MFVCRTVACLLPVVSSLVSPLVSRVLSSRSTSQKSPLLLFVVVWSHSNNGSFYSYRCICSWDSYRDDRSITWGILIQYFIQFGCSDINGVASFRIPWGLQMIPAIVLVAGMTLFPESPRWLLDHNRYVVLSLLTRVCSRVPQTRRSSSSFG
jgi:hypothetical protein